MAIHDPPLDTDSGWQRDKKQRYNPAISRESLSREAKRQRQQENVGTLPLQLPVRLPAANRPRPVCAWLRYNDLPILLIEEPANGKVRAYVRGDLKQLECSAISLVAPEVEPAKPKRRKRGSEDWGDPERLVWSVAAHDELEELAAWAEAHDVQIPDTGLDRLKSKGIALREINREADLAMRLNCNLQAELRAASAEKERMPSMRLQRQRDAMTKARQAKQQARQEEEDRINAQIDQLLQEVWARQKQARLASDRQLVAA